MSVFEYKGYSPEGKKVGGIVDADNARAARGKLTGQGVLVTSVSEDSGAREIARDPISTLFNRIHAKDIATFTRQLATLQGGGLDIVESLNAIQDQFENVRFKKVITDIRENIVAGSSLADSLSKHGSHFDPLYINLVTTAEASGTLDETLNRLAMFQEKKIRQDAKLMAAMIYPILMTFIGSFVLLYLLVYVTPRVQVMFEDMNQALPIPTIILMSVSSFLQKWWIVLLVLTGLTGFTASRYIKTEKGKALRDKMLLSLPIFGNLIRTAAIARFSRALAVLLAGGVTLVESLNITGKIVGSVPIEKAVQQAIVNITEGQTMAEPLRNSGMFPPVVTQMIDAGERSGNLADMLKKIADAYDFEVETATGALVSLVEPVLILTMGLVVGFIVMAVLLPIFELSQMSI